MKREPAYVEGIEAHTRFVGAMKTILSVPREEMLRREETYRKEAALNPRKRGPKPKKIQNSASRDLGGKTPA